MYSNISRFAFHSRNVLAYPLEQTSSSPCLGPLLRLDGKGSLRSGSLGLHSCIKHSYSKWMLSSNEKVGLSENSNKFQTQYAHQIKILNEILYRSYSDVSLLAKKSKKKSKTSRSTLRKSMRYADIEDESTLMSSMSNRVEDMKIQENPSIRKKENSPREKGGEKSIRVPSYKATATRILGLNLPNDFTNESKNESKASTETSSSESARTKFHRKTVTGKQIEETEFNDKEIKFVEETFFAPQEKPSFDNHSIEFQKSSSEPRRRDAKSFSTSKLSLLSYARLADMTDYIQKAKKKEGKHFYSSAEKVNVKEFENALLPSVYKYFAANDIQELTDIQARSLATALKRPYSKNNPPSVLIASQTGTGKTLAYLLPVVNNIKVDEVYGGIGIQAYRPRALILVPSKQLASQVCRVAKSISHTAKFRTALFRSDFKTRRMRVDAEDADIIVSTPGIWTHMVEKGYAHYSDIQYVVVDEADSMLDEKAFGKEASNILKEVAKRRPDTQYYFAMATVNHSILDWIAQYAPKAQVLVSDSIHRPVSSVTQSFIDCSHIDKLKDCLLPLLKKESEPTIVFCNTIDSARAVNLFLMENDIHTANFHAEIRPRDQHEEFERFRKGIVSVLVTTDIASRGLDLTFVKHVINFDFPKNHVDYIHRIGRTGRMGSHGRVTSLLRKHDKGLAEAIKRAITEERRIDSIKNRILLKKTRQEKPELFKRSSVIAKRLLQKSRKPPTPW